METTNLRRRVWPVPSEEFVMQTSLVPEEIVRRLIEAIEPRKTLWIGHSRRYDKRFEGEVTGLKFQLRRIIPAVSGKRPFIALPNPYQSFAPFLNGAIETAQAGSSVQVRIGPGCAVADFWTLALSVAIAFSLLAGSMGMVSLGLNLILLSIMVVTGTIVAIYYRFEAGEARKFLADLLAD